MCGPIPPPSAPSLTWAPASSSSDSVRCTRGDDMIGGRDHNRADYENLHRNKESLTLNMKEPEGLAILHELVKDADVHREQNPPALSTRYRTCPLQQKGRL